MNLDPVVLITGGGQGLERAFAQAQAGPKVAVTARSEAELAQTVELIEQASAPMNDYVVASPQVRERAPAVQQ